VKGSIDVDEINKLTDKVIGFRDERNWKQFHNPKDLAISLSLEASELLENFQWKNSEEAIKEKMENIEDELADVLIYAFLLADDLDLDIAKIVENKLQKNNEKYPVEKAYGVSNKYTEL
jgi:NTP pyrophosphatase (non-canonical NTP hydrolase)